MSTTPVPTVGGRYEMLRTLGRGSFGHTFLARDRELERHVAVKVLETGYDAKGWELFQREAQVLRAVTHHGIPQVYDSLSDDWQGKRAAFLVMEYVEGTSIAQIIEERRILDSADVIHVFLELLGILDYLHGRVPPILHRDIKPANIIVRPNGFPAVVDFGSVRRIFLGPEESGSTVAGTYGYMPYEQYMGQASPSSDLFAAAATLLHLLTGRPPRDFMNTEGRIEVPETLPGDARLRTVIARMLRPSPAERYPSAREVRAALVGAGSGTAVATTAMPGTVTKARGALVDAVLALPPAPRPLTGTTLAMLKASTPGVRRMMTSSEKKEEWTFSSYASLVFFSILTAGILPTIFLQMTSARRRRMKRFFADGIPAVAEILSMERHGTAFEEQLSRVAYQFEADGEIQRDSDTVLPAIADRWQVGGVIPILYIPDRQYDSVIVATE